MLIPRINCIYFTEFGKCNHLERGRGFLWLGKSCILSEKFPSECSKRIKHKNPIGPPPNI